jgi:hypothetical protein
MKILKIAFTLFTLLLLTSFNNKDINEEVKTYVKFSVSSNQINNTFNISGDQNNSSQNVTAMIFPDGNSGEYKIAELSFMDASQEMSVYFKIPAKSSLVEIKDTNPELNFSISIGNVNLEAQSVSVNVDDVVIDKIMRMKASYAKGSFEGIFFHEYTKNNTTYKEPYLISGDFQFISPRYKPKRK